MKDAKNGISVNFENYVKEDLLLNEEGSLAISPNHFIEKKEINSLQLSLNLSCAAELAPKQFYFINNLLKNSL